MPDSRSIVKPEDVVFPSIGFLPNESVLLERCTRSRYLVCGSLCHSARTCGVSSIMACWLPIK